MLAWHFLAEDRRLRYGRQSLVKPGQTLKRNPHMLSLCKYGLHASENAIDALKWAPGPIVCRVRLGGTIITDTDKAVASRRTVLWMADATSTLRLFACWCVRNTPLASGGTVWDLLTDERSRNAVEVAERHAVGDATDDELATARDAAWDAACDAARDAAWDAAWDAASYAARDAASYAASYAAGYAASYAASYAARDAARDAQRNQLGEMLSALEPH